MPNIYAVTGKTFTAGKAFIFTGNSSGSDWEIDYPSVAGGFSHGVTQSFVDEFTPVPAWFTVSGPQFVFLSGNVSPGDELTCDTTGKFRVRLVTEVLDGIALKSGSNGGSAPIIILDSNTLFNNSSLAQGDMLVRNSSGWQKISPSTSGTMLTSIGTSTIPTYQALTASQVPALDASKITTGILATAQIPSLDASKITSGSLATAQLPVVSEAKGGFGVDISAIGTGLVTRTAANTYTPRTLTAGTGISISNGSGVSGNPTISAANGSVLQSVTSRVSADQTTTSSTLVDLTGASVTLTTSASSKLLINVSYSMSNASALGSTNRIALLIDGTVETNSGFTTPLISNVVQGGSFAVLKSGLSAGSHTIKLQWSNTTGTTQCRPVATTLESAIITVMEITA